MVADDHEAGVDSRPQLQAEAALGDQAVARALDVGGHPEGRTDGVARIVFAGRRVAEGDQQRTARHRSHVSARAHRELAEPFVLAVEKLVQLFDVGGQALGRHHRDATGHDRHLPPLALRHRLGGGRVGALGAGDAEGAEQRLDRHLALLDGLRGGGLEEPAEPPVTEARRDRHGVAGELLHDDLVGRAAAHHHLAGQALEEDERPGVEVRALRRGLAPELLGRGVAGCAYQLARHREPRQGPTARLAREAAEAEVEHERVPPRARLRYHDVLGLEVAVDDAASVRARERVEHLRHEIDRLGPTEAPLPCEDVLEGRARHVLEDGVELAVAGLAGVDQADDVRVRQLGAQPRLAPEALDLVRDVGGRVALPEAQDLDRDQLPGRELARLVDAPEPSRAELFEDLVRVLELGPGGQGSGPPDRPSASWRHACGCLPRLHGGPRTKSRPARSGMPSAR